MLTITNLGCAQPGNPGLKELFWSTPAHLWPAVPCQSSVRVRPRHLLCGLGACGEETGAELQRAAVRAAGPARSDPGPPRSEPRPARRGACPAVRVGVRRLRDRPGGRGEQSQPLTETVVKSPRHFNCQSGLMGYKTSPAPQR